MAPAACDSEARYGWRSRGHLSSAGKHLLKRSACTVQTVAMAAGTEVHEKLEAEIHEVVTVPTESREDDFAVQVLNLVQGVRELLASGVSRETPVWARLALPPEAGQEETGDVMASDSQSPVLVGIIDEMVLVPSTTEAGASKAGQPRHIRIVDSKTRASGTMPSESASKPGMLQVNLYALALERLVHCCRGHVGGSRQDGKRRKRSAGAGCLWEPMPAQEDLAWLLDFFECKGACLRGPLSAGVLAAAERQGLIVELLQRSGPLPEGLTGTDAGGVYASLAGAVDVMAHAVAALPPLAATGELVYRSQKDKGAVIGRKAFPLRRGWATALVRRSLQYRAGAREAAPVPEQEWYKCRYCAFLRECGPASPMVAQFGMPPDDWQPEGHEGARVTTHGAKRTEDSDEAWIEAAAQAVAALEQGSKTQTPPVLKADPPRPAD